MISPVSLIPCHFSDALDAARSGACITRAVWPGGTFAFVQVPSSVPPEIVRKMSSLPSAVKREFERRGNPSLHYRNQMALVHEDNIIEGYSPTVEDVLAVDWQIIVEAPYDEHQYQAAPVSETAGTAIPELTEYQRTGGRAVPSNLAPGPD